jgi:hypothetical protein
MGIKCTIKTFLCERSSLPEEPPAPVGRRTALPPSLTYRVLSKDLYNVMARTQIGSGFKGVPDPDQEGMIRPYL